MAKQIDMAKAKELWDNGLKIDAMCVALRTTAKTFQKFKRNNPETFTPRKKPVKGVHGAVDVARAAILWNDGKSYAEIGETLGRSRNSISGMMNRNRHLFPERFGDKKKTHTSAKSIPRPKKTEEQKAEEKRAKVTSNQLRKMFNEAFKAAAPIPSKAESAEYDNSRLPYAQTLADLPATGCKWCLTDGGPFLMCAADRRKGKQYCEPHYQRAWRQT